MARLLRVLLAIAMLVLVPAVVAYADESDEFATEWDQRWNEIAAMETEKVALHTRYYELIDEVSAIDPDGEDAADALSSLDEAETVLDDMIANLQSLLAGFIRQKGMVPSQDVKLQAYLEQMMENTELELERTEVFGELLARYEIVWDPSRVDDLKVGERQKLVGELDELTNRLYRLTAQIDELYATAQDTWGDMTGTGPTVPTHVWLLALAAVSALASGVLARSEGLNVVGWAIVGFLAPVVAVIALLFVSRGGRRRQPAPAISHDGAGTTEDAEGSTDAPSRD